MISPCKGCGATLEHDQDPRTVLCGGCDKDRQLKAMKDYPPPPPPPPMRQAYSGHGERVALMIFIMLVGVIMGMAMGWKMAGGS